MEIQSPLDSYYSLWLQLARTRHAIFKVREKDLRRYNITPEQVGVLYTLDNTRVGVTITEIARQMLREPHSMSGLVQRMEKKGLVKRTIDPNRNNIFNVTMTEMGRNIYHSALPTKENIQDIFSVLSEKQCKQIRLILELVNKAAIDKLNEYYGTPF